MLEIKITFEVVQLSAPNDHWYEVTPVLSSPDGIWQQRGDTALCLKDEIEQTKEGYTFLVSRRFKVI